MSHLRPLYDLVASNGSAEWTKDKDDETCAQEWADFLFEPLPKGIKYSKALARILDATPIVFHALEHKDDKIFEVCDTASTYIDPTKGDPKHWAAVSGLCRMVASHVNRELPRVPSRAEISENIASHRTSKKSASSGAASDAPHAFKTALATLAQTIGSSEMQTRVQSMQEKEVNEECQAWRRMMDASPTFTEHIKERIVPAAEAWEALPRQEAQDLVVALSSSSTHAAWGNVEQINSFAQLHGHIPTGIMSRIEKISASLADDIANGASLESMDLTRIGEQVLSECDSSEISDLTSNLASILPVLGSMKMEEGAPSGLASTLTELSALSAAATPALTSAPAGEPRQETRRGRAKG